MLTEITEKNDWEDYQPMKDQGLFLQSFNQKKLYESLGQKTWLFESSGARSLVTKIEARRGTFLFLPYGPMGDHDHLSDFFAELKDLARQEKAAFIRISPYWEENDSNQHILTKLGFKQAPLHMLAETLWLLDLEGKTEDELMMGMDKKHRNLVRRAAKDGVEIKTSSQPEAVERFIDLHWQTMGRHKFTPYPKDYFRDQVRLFAEDDEVLVFEAYHDGELLASAIIMYYGQVAAYHHGASSFRPEHRKIPASYLLQWEVIREAQRRGLKAYNFWGIAPGKNPNSSDSTEERRRKHPFYGITHFKTGFGGHQHDLTPCHDLIINKKYYLNWIVERVRKAKRGF